MTEQDLRDLLHRTTDDLGPDVAGLVAGGAARGRARRRRHLAGTTAAAVLTVGAVAAASAVLGAGGGSSAQDDGFADGGRQSLVDASVATHDATPRQLATEDRVSETLAHMVGSDQQGWEWVATIGTADAAGGDGPGYQSITAAGEWRGAHVGVSLTSAQPAAMAVAEGEDPAEPVPYAGPERACRQAERDAEHLVVSCHEVDNGDWAYSTLGRGDYRWFVAESSEGRVETGIDREITTQAGVALFTTDGWVITTDATSPEGTDTPVLDAADLQLMTQDGDWFLAPGEEPAAPPSAGAQGSVSSDGVTGGSGVTGQASLPPGGDPILVPADPAG